MSHFGGTVVSYMVVFGMLDALKALDQKLAVRNFALNVRCPLSGYLPAHAAIVSSRKDVYDYLCDHCGCDEFAQVRAWHECRLTEQVVAVAPRPRRPTAHETPFRMRHTHPP